MPQLSHLLDLPPHPLIAIVGAGGKTTTMYTLAHELAQHGKRIITTTTTNIFPPQSGETDTLIISPDTPTLLIMIQSAWPYHHHITVAASTTSAGKLAGLQPDQPHQLLTQSGADAIIVEADGARHRMIKAPAEHEPLIPTHTNLVLLMLSAEAINQTLNSEIAHRPERIAALLDMNQGEILTPTRIANLMLNEQGGLKHIPETAVTYLLITHATAQRQAAVQAIAALAQSSPRIAAAYYSVQPAEWFA